MQIELSERVKTTLHTLSREDREKAHAWIDYLQKWEENPFAKSRSVALTVQGHSMYLFRTTGDTRIFYTVDLATKTVFVIDLTSKDTILASGTVSNGGS